MRMESGCMGGWANLLVFRSSIYWNLASSELLSWCNQKPTLVTIHNRNTFHQPPPPTATQNMSYSTGHWVTGSSHSWGHLVRNEHGWVFEEPKLANTDAWSDTITHTQERTHTHMHVRTYAHTHDVRMYAHTQTHTEWERYSLAMFETAFISFTRGP